MISINKKIINFKNAFRSEYNLSKVLENYNNIQNDFPVINVVGTNGKGSVSKFLSLGFKEKYSKVGLFISPAFLYHNERIQINNEPISDKDLKFYLKFFKKDINKYNLTFFEIWTLIAAKYFSDKKIDIAIVEAGIGGRKDCTNLFEKQLCSVCTSIGLDHTEVLGDTVEKIIYEKSGIAKQNNKFFIASNNEKYIDIFKKFINNEIIVASNDNSKEGYQKINFGLAKKILEYFKIKFNEKKIFCPPLGRMTILRKKPLLIIDGCHNVDGVNEMISYSKEFKNDFIVLFGASYSKNYKKMISSLKSNFKNIKLAEFKHFKSWKISNEYCDLKIKNWKKFLIKNANKNIIVCGSLYFIPLVYNWYRKRAEKKWFT